MSMLEFRYGIIIIPYSGGVVVTDLGFGGMRGLGKTGPTSGS